MKSSALTGTAAAFTALALLLSACGSDDKSESASGSSSATSSATTTSAPAPKPNQTVAEYITASGITQTVANSGVQGAPVVDLPTPEGWEVRREGLPQGSYGGIGYTGPDAAPGFPPTIFAYLSKLDGPADPAKILELAPNELRGLQGYEPSSPGAPGKLGGFDAYELAGTALIEGQRRFIAQKTVVIPGPKGLYMLLLNAYAAPEQQDKLGTAMGVIDNETVITP
jgi:hypothetical protein